MTQTALPTAYTAAPAKELLQRIDERRRQLGPALCVLAHHYQVDEIVERADFVGDSLKLSQTAAERKQARFIVFCGVHFMAESADILTAPEQAVCLPNLLAGCAMADMADDDDVQAAIEEVAELSAPARIVPVTYVNSTAAAKAVTARFGGACCTSSNAANVFRWALTAAGEGGASGAGGEKVFAIPDQHLGRNTAVALGYRLEDCVVYDPAKPTGGLSREDVRRARFILWKGHCYVHQVFRPKDVERVRAAMPGATVIVHPECPYEVVRLSDAAGSTEQIIRAVAEGTPGSRWAVGTEANLVRRLARRHADREIRVLADRPAHCTQMARITPAHLAWVLDRLAEGEIVNRVSVPPDVTAEARVALQRMLRVKAATEAVKIDQD